MIELQKIPLDFTSETEREIFYEGEIISRRRLDLLINENILVELKAITAIDNSCYAQVINYLRVFQIEVGLLLNFGARSLQFKRFINKTESVKSF